MRLGGHLALPTQMSNGHVCPSQCDGVAGRCGQLVHEVCQGKVAQSPSTERFDHRLTEPPLLHPWHEVKATVKKMVDTRVVKVRDHNDAKEVDE